MNGYALVSACDTIPWCTLEAAQKHIITVENISRASSKYHHTEHNRILQAEMQVRCEWTRVAQLDSRYTLSDVIEIVSRRHSIWPVTNDLRGQISRDWKTGINKTTPYSEGSSSGRGKGMGSLWQNQWKGMGKGLDSSVKTIFVAI